MFSQSLCNFLNPVLRQLHNIDAPQKKPKAGGNKKIMEMELGRKYHQSRIKDK